MENYDNQKTHLKFKILSVPMIMIFIIIVAIASISIWTAKSKVIDQMQVDGMMMTNQISDSMTNNAESTKTLNSSIETRISTLATFIKDNNDKVNNDYLNVIAKEFQVDEINVTDPTGKIIYSNLPTSLGYVYKQGDSAYQILNGGKNVVMEDMRKSTKSNNYYKYGCIKNTDGGIIQIGILANKIQSLTSKMQPQNIVNTLTKDKSIIYALYMDNNLKVIAHTDKSRIGIKLTDIGSRTAAVDGKPYSSKFKYKNQINVYDVIYPVIIDGKTAGAVDIGISMENANKAVYNIIGIIVVLSIIAFAVCAFILLKISKGITEPLDGLVYVSKKIADGDLNVEINVNSNDEIGILADSFKNMSDNLRNTIGTIKNNSLKVSSMSSDLKTNSGQMTGAANDVASAVQEVTRGTTQQASDLVEISNSMVGLADELQNIYSKLSEVKESSGTTNIILEEGRKQIDRLLKSIKDVRESFGAVSEKINGLSSSVSKVGSITDVINGILDQTNLLALNAAIEAARAGEAGKGFAVVAEEVRQLAEKSKESTEQIQHIIQSISNETKDVILTSNKVNSLVENQEDTVNGTKNSFEKISHAVEGIGPLLENTYNSLKMTVKSKDDVLGKVESVTAVSEETSASSQEISASSEEMFASSENVDKYASELNDIVNKLNEETDKFKI
ncbi:methyl-accepting chemotaxis protein [Clostridium sp. Mt-5]|uniref:Methyl-accepting chemotaxis protein n=1 Tax=Clostridium moutaii TaxID=3240932 RepID=A0ABV4BPE6_9CLOT